MMKRIFLMGLLALFVTCSFAVTQVQPKQKIVSHHSKSWGSLTNYLDTLEMKKPQSEKTQAKQLAKTSPAQIPPKTTLSKKATMLQMGITRQQVQQLLGKPTWAQSYTGMPLDWTWRNGKCNPVDVTFDKNMLVSGYDEGWAQCFKTKNYSPLPNRKHLCSNLKNKALCSVDQKIPKPKPVQQKKSKHHFQGLA